MNTGDHNLEQEVKEMYLVANCLCGRELHMPVEQGRVITTTCGECGSAHDISIYKHSFRTKEYCKCNELVKAKCAEATDPCNPSFCCGGKCKCATKK
jgi:hypothetical protein